MVGSTQSDSGIQKDMSTTNRLDKATHKYHIAGRPVPSVTQIIRAILGDAIWSASDWYLDRGKAVHAAAAFIARGKQFEHDPQITGQVAACRLFFKENDIEVLEVEQPIYSMMYQFAGTMDLHCRLKGRDTIIDWKSALSEVAEIQVGGYAIERPDAKWGLIVALQENGRYKAGKMFKLAQRKNEFLALRSVYGMRQRLGLIREVLKA